MPRCSHKRTFLLLAIFFLAAAAGNCATAVDASSFGARVDLSSGWLFAAWRRSCLRLAAVGRQHVDARRGAQGFPEGGHAALPLRLVPAAPPACIRMPGTLHSPSRTSPEATRSLPTASRSADTAPCRRAATRFKLRWLRTASRPLLSPARRERLSLLYAFSVPPADLLSRGVVTPLGEESSISLVTPDQASRDASYAFAHREIFNIGLGYSLLFLQPVRAGPLHRAAQPAGVPRAWCLCCVRMCIRRTAGLGAVPVCRPLSLRHALHPASVGPDECHQPRVRAPAGAPAAQRADPRHPGRHACRCAL